MQRDARWSESLAVGTQPFVENVKRELGLKTRHRGIDEDQGSLVFRQKGPAYRVVFYGKNEGPIGKKALKTESSSFISWGWRNPAPLLAIHFITYCFN